MGVNYQIQHLRTVNTVQLEKKYSKFAIISSDRRYQRVVPETSQKGLFIKKTGQKGGSWFPANLLVEYVARKK